LENQVRKSQVATWGLRSTGIGYFLLRRCHLSESDNSKSDTTSCAGLCVCPVLSAGADLSFNVFWKVKNLTDP
jgi:hypothetical protein